MRLILVLSLLAGLLKFASAAEPPPRPNILFCIADDASQPHFGAYGCDWVKTPAFDRVAREGLLFTNCWTPNAKCAPSRACILTGRNSWQLGAAMNHWCYFPPKFKSYVEALGENGYHVGKVAKGWAPGIAVDEKGVRRNLAGPAYNSKKAKPPAAGITSIDYAANFADFLAKKPADKPFCFWYGCVEPHRRYEYGSGVAKGGKSIDDIDEVYPFWPDNEVIRNDMLDYAYEIEHFDRHLGLMLKHLEEQGELDNTLVVVTSDNGMPFPRIKGQEFALSNHLPLAVMWKGKIKHSGRTIDDFVNFIDYAPTFLEVAGLTQESADMQPITGKSLTQYFYNDSAGTVDKSRDHVLIGKERHDIGRPNDWGYPIRGIVKGDYLYLHNFETDRWPAGNPETGYLNCDGSPTKTAILNLRREKIETKFWEWSFGKRPADQLFNIAKDKACMNNLADDQPERVAELKKQMFSELREQGDQRILGEPDFYEKLPYASNSDRNYYEKYMRGEKKPAGWVSPGDYEKQNQ